MKARGAKRRGFLVGDSRVGDGMVGDGMVSDGRVSDGMVGDGRVGDGRVGSGTVREGVLRVGIVDVGTRAMLSVDTLGAKSIMRGSSRRVERVMGNGLQGPPSRRVTPINLTAVFQGFGWLLGG